MVDKLNPKALAITFVLFTVVFDLTGYVWHGLLKQPSMLNQTYPGFWSDYTLMLYGLMGSVIYAYAIGYVFAWIFNWANKKFK